MAAGSTTTVTFRVVGLERVRGAGRARRGRDRWCGSAGSGDAVSRRRDRLVAEPPQLRHAETGERSAVTLPEELSEAIAHELRGVLSPRGGRADYASLTEIFETPLETRIEHALDDR